MAGAKIQQLDLTRFAKTIVDEWLPLVRETAVTGKILNGPHKKAFEEEFARYLGVKYVLGVTSGTDAIKMSFEALGIRKGDEIITHANAFIADIEAILAVGAVPVLVDMSETDYGPNIRALEKAITKKTKAILAVHLCGLPVDLEPLLQVAQRQGVPVVEDVSQSQGAEYHGKKVGSFGKINAFSLGTVKNLAGIGDAGAIATNDPGLYEKIKVLAVHGQVKKYEHEIYGWNSRLDEIQASWLRLGLKTLDARNAKRRDVYKTYRKQFSDLPVKCMPDLSDRGCIYHQAIIETARRAELQKYLEEKGVGTGIYYPFSLHQQTAWKNAGLATGSFPRAERYAKENLSLPIFAELTDDEVQHITSSVRTFFGK